MADIRPIDGLDTRKVAGEAGKRRTRNRKRTSEATTVRRINAKARERQEAWSEGGQPNKVASCTTDLEVLFHDRRIETAGTFTTPYRGSTSKARG